MSKEQKITLKQALEEFEKLFKNYIVPVDDIDNIRNAVYDEIEIFWMNKIKQLVKSTKLEDINSDVFDEMDNITGYNEDAYIGYCYAQEKQKKLIEKVLKEE